jgi:hypothetical protein
MASAFDDLLGNLVNKLKGAGVGSGKTAAQKRAEIDYLTPSNIAAQAGQGTVSGPAEFYDMSRRTDYTYKPREYDKTIPIMNRGMLSGDGLGLAAPATSYSSTPTSTTDRRSTGRGMYGMGTTPEDGFSMGLFDAATLANQQPTDNYGVTTVTDPETGKEFVIDGYGRTFVKKPESQTTIDYNAVGGLENMFKNIFASDGNPVVLDTGTSLITGAGVAPNLEGNPFTFIADGIGGMLSDMDARANPGNVRDQTVRARRADNARDVAEEKIRIEQMMMQGAIASGLTPREAQKQVKSQQGQRRVEEEQLKRKQERDIALADAENLGYDQEEMDLEIQRLANKAPKPVEEDQGIVEKIMDLVASPVYGADVIENAPVQYDDFGNVISQPDPVVEARRALAFNPDSVRNVRNNNPGNIKINKANDWNGSISNPNDKTFESFQTPEYGVRALNKVVNANIKATNNFEEFVNRYASEPSEQAYFKQTGKLKPHLQNYAESLARSQQIDTSTNFPKSLDKKALLRAIIRHEGGQESLSYYDDSVLDAGLKLK